MHETKGSSIQIHLRLNRLQFEWVSIEFRPSLARSLLRSECKFSTQAAFFSSSTVIKCHFFDINVFVALYLFSFINWISLHPYEIYICLKFVYFVRCFIHLLPFFATSIRNSLTLYYLWLVFFSLFLNKVTQKSRMLMKKKSTQEQT